MPTTEIDSNYFKDMFFLSMIQLFKGTFFYSLGFIPLTIEKIAHQNL